MKRVISMVLVLMLVLSLAVSASAATVENQTGHTYNAYQIFSGTQAEGSANLGDIEWGDDIDGDALLDELQADSDYFDGCNNAMDVATILQEHASSKTFARGFANYAVKHLKADATPIAISANASSEVTLTAGYYLLVDTTVVGEGDAQNPALLQVTNVGNVTIAKKYDVPVPDKNILGTASNGEHNHTKKTNASIGQDVTFHLKATLPSIMADFDTYRLVFHDDLSAGLTFKPESVKVTVGGTEVTKGTDYTLVETPTADCKGTDGTYDCDFEVVFTNVMAAPGYAAGCDVIVEYKATVNEDAVIEGPNPNDMRLEYSNNPNWTPDTPGEVPPTGVTPWVEVNVYTGEVQLWKTDGATDKALAGAEFTITGDMVEIVKTTTNQFTPYASGETHVPGNMYWELDNGTYTSTNPNTTGLDTSHYVDTSVVYKNETVEAFIQKDATGVNVKATVGEDGILKFGGLGAGTYNIEETVVPAGYNKIDDLTLTVTFDESTGTFTYSWTGGAQGSGYVITVENNTGSVLPETGGMGTTLFYLIGGLMVAASAVLLVTKKRMIAE